MMRIYHTARTRLFPLYIAALCMGAISVMALVAGCGAGNLEVTAPAPSPTVERHPGEGTGTPSGEHANLFSRIDYPFQIPVNASDSVTLTLSPDVNILRVTPTPNPQGTPSASAQGPAIPLPTDKNNYQDISVSANVTGNAGPVVWNQTGLLSQSLLQPAQPGEPRLYIEQPITFTWNVRAIAAGENAAQIILTLTYTYLDGSLHSGTTNLTPDGVPIVAIAPSFFTITLPNFKLPIISLASLGSVIALFNLLQNITGVIQAGRTVKHATDVVLQHTHHPPDALPPTQKKR